jgi:hypothetical protein
MKRWPWRSKMRRSQELEEAHRERQVSKQKRVEAEPLAVSLRDMREQNHIRPLLRTLIQGTNDSKE